MIANITKIRRILILLASFLTLFWVGAAYAQEGDAAADEPEIPPPSYLEQRAETADQNLLAQIFGDIALAASGQIDLADVILQGPDGGFDPDNTDSVLSAVMFIFLMGVLGFTGFIVIILILLMGVQSAIEGKVLTQRYNEWTVIRTVYAILAMLPIAGGWSIGQYAVLNTTFMVNSVANEMHHTANRWVYGRGSVVPFRIEGYEYRQLMESIYLSTLCQEINNDYIRQKHQSYQEYMAELEQRANSGTLSERATASVSLGVRRVLGLLEDHEAFFVTGEEFFEDAYRLESIMVTYDGSWAYEYAWGSDETTRDSCGRVDFDVHVGLQVTNEDGGMPEIEGGGSLDMGPRNKTFVEAYFRAHMAALQEAISNAQADITHVLTAVRQIEAQHPPSDMDLMQAELKELAQNDPLVAAFGNAFSPHAVSTQTGFDAILYEQIGQYTNRVRSTYNDETQAGLQAFDALLNELHNRQRLGPAADYSAVYEPDSDSFANAGERDFHALIKNTEKGWMYAGFKWWELSRTMGFQMELRKQKPGFVNFIQNISEHSSEIEDRLTIYAGKYYQMESLRQVIDTPGRPVNPEQNLPPYNPDYIKAYSEEYSGDISGWLSEYQSKLGDWLTRKIIRANFDFTERDLLANIQNAGHNYISIAEGLYIGSVAANVTPWGRAIKAMGKTKSKSVAGGRNTNAASNAIGGILSKVMLVLMIVGFIYAIYLPLLPAMIWTFGIIGWLEKLIALVVILPLWMAGHIIPDSDGLVNGVGRQGYVLFVNVVARPPLMVLTIHFAMAALGAIGFFLNDFVGMFMPSVNKGYVSALVIPLGSIVVFSGFIVVVAHLILAWIYKIPDEAATYIGGSAGNFGESEGKGHLQAVGGIVNQKVEQGAGEMAGGGDKNQRQRGNNKRF